MSSPGKGGRGKKAPYSTIHYRIPEHIKPIVERLAATYKIMKTSDNDEECSSLLERVDSAITATDSEDEFTANSNQTFIESLQADLAAACEEIEKLRTEREQSANILKTALKLGSREGVKMKELIRQAFPELPKK